MLCSGGELWPKQQSHQDVVQFLFGHFHGDESVPFKRSVTVKLRVISQLVMLINLNAQTPN